MGVLGLAFSCSNLPATEDTRMTRRRSFQGSHATPHLPKHDASEDRPFPMAFAILSSYPWKVWTPPLVPQAPFPFLRHPHPGVAHGTGTWFASARVPAGWPMASPMTTRE